MYPTTGPVEPQGRFSSKDMSVWDLDTDEQCLRCVHETEGPETWGDLIIAWCDKVVLPTESELPICGGVQAAMCQVAREKPGTGMGRLSVRPGRVHTAHYKDASTEQAREWDLESAHRSWTEARQLGKSLAIPRRRRHKGRTCPGLHGLPREMSSWRPPSTV